MFTKFSATVLFAVLFQSLGTISTLYPYFEFYGDNDYQDGLALEMITLQSNESSSGCVPVVYPMVNASTVMVFTNEKCILDALPAFVAMAEVLGVVASGIAVAQLADQIVSSIRNIHYFWKLIRNAPQEVNDALEELEILGDTLLELHTNLSKRERPELPRNAAAKCLTYCRKVADNLESIVVVLQQGLDGKKGRRQWAAVKAALQKQTLQDFQQRLDRAKSMLTLAISCYSLSYYQHSFSLLLANTSNVEPQGSPPKPPDDKIRMSLEPRAARLPVTQYRKYSKNSKALPFIGLFQYQSTSTPPRWRKVDSTSDGKGNDEDLVVEYKIIPATWMRLRALSFQRVRSCGAWKYNFRQFRVVPFGPIFKACKNGRVEDIIEILGEGSASLYDVDDYGWSLLHYAALGANSDVCRWLIDQGVDSNAVDNDLMTPLFLLECQWSPKKEDEDKVYNTARVLVEHGQIDPMSVDYRGGSIPHHFIGSLKTFKYLIQSQEQFMIDLSQTDFYGRTPLQAKAVTAAQNVPILLKYLLNNSPTSTEIAREVWLEGDEPMTLLLGSVIRLSAVYFYLKPIETELEFISELILAGSDLHVRKGFGATPLDHLLNGMWSTPHEEPNRECLLLLWMSCLCRCGIDLQQYWRKEEELHKDRKLIPVDVHRRNIDRMFTVYYGSSRDDVTVLVEDVYQNLDDRPSVPGNWDTEAEYAEKHCVSLIEGRPLAFWSITTAGFQDGNYSFERASCDTEIKYWRFGDNLKISSTDDRKG